MIKIALTIDVEPDTGQQNSFAGITRAMPKLLDLAEEYQIPFTWFITHDAWSKVDEKFPSIVARMAHAGEIGCHVHFRNENYQYRTDYSFQKKLIQNATNSLRAHGFDVVSFRGGAQFFNEDTFKILEELDYKLDSSVVPGLYHKPVAELTVNHKRCTIMKPYFPSREDHCRCGNSEILEVPLSVYPLISFKIGVMTASLALPLSLGSITQAPARALNRIQKLAKSGANIYVTLSYHPYNFISEMDEQFSNLKSFFAACQNRPDLKFFTLKEIRATLPKDYINEDNAEGYRIIILLSNLSRLRRLDRWIRSRKWSGTR